MNGWVGVDLDGTLAYYGGWKGVSHIGEPIPLMVKRVKQMLAAGTTVKIFTARVATRSDLEYQEAMRAIIAWCVKHIGQELEVTCEKDRYMITLYDDRCVQVEMNTGEFYIDKIGGTACD